MTIPKPKLRLIHPGRPRCKTAMASARLDRPASTATTMCGVMTTMRIYTTWRHDADTEVHDLLLPRVRIRRVGVRVAVCLGRVIVLPAPAVAYCARGEE